ncbi:MAG: hypothetical protein JWO60_1051 [Frankiales bacterium]|nr:hypothetical protein [Frankiales bacterium]
MLEHPRPGPVAGRLRARDLVSRDLATLSAPATVAEAVALMRHLGVRHLPLFGEHGLLGLVHLDALQAAAGDGTGADRPVQAQEVPSVRLDDDLLHVAAEVARSACAAVVVLDGQERLLGVITDVDLPARVVRLPDLPEAPAPQAHR